MSDVQRDIEDYLDRGPYAVVGASTDRSKYGNKVLRAFLQNQREVFAVNPQADEVEGVKSYPDLESLPESGLGIFIIKSFMDQVVYRPGAPNLLEMTKRIVSRPEQAATV